MELSIGPDFTFIVFLEVVVESKQGGERNESQQQQATPELIG